MADSFIDATNTPFPQPTRWDRGDGAAAIAALDQALAKAGLPGGLEAPKRLLARAEELFSQARAAKEAAAERLDEATRALLADGPVDTAEYGRALVDAGPWLDDQAAGMVGVMNAGHRAVANATQTTFAMATGLYRELSQVCAGVVGEIEQVPALPRSVWAAPRHEAPSAAARVGHEGSWASLVRLGDRFDACHSASRLLRETGVFQQELIFPDGCPTEVGVMFLNWQPAAEQLPEVRRLPGPLRIRAAVDRGWKPGLWLRSDHEAEQARVAAEPKPRSLLARLVG